MQRQLVAGGVAACVVAWLEGGAHGIAVFMGVLLMVGNALWLSHSVMAVDVRNEKAARRALYKGVALRFAALLAALLLAGFAGLQLLYIALGMFIAQAAIFFLALRRLVAEKAEFKGF